MDFVTFLIEMRDKGRNATLFVVVVTGFFFATIFWQVLLPVLAVLMGAAIVILFLACLLGALFEHVGRLRWFRHGRSEPESNPMEDWSPSAYGEKFLKRLRANKRRYTS
jgi:hypothetical protein